MSLTCPNHPRDPVHGGLSFGYLIIRFPPLMSLPELCRALLFLIIQKPRYTLLCLSQIYVFVALCGAVWTKENQTMCPVLGV